MSGRSFDDSVSPVAVTDELGDGADLAGLELADRLLLLAVQEEQLADALLVVAVPGVPDMALGVERAGQDAEVGQPADERVGGGLEDPDEQRPVRVRVRSRRSCRPCRSAVAAPSSAGEGR